MRLFLLSENISPFPISSSNMAIKRSYRLSKNVNIAICYEKRKTPLLTIMAKQSAIASCEITKDGEFLQVQLLLNQYGKRQLDVVLLALISILITSPL